MFRMRQTASVFVICGGSFLSSLTFIGAEIYLCVLQIYVPATDTSSRNIDLKVLKKMPNFYRIYVLTMVVHFST